MAARKRILTSALASLALALALLGANGLPEASADASDLKIKETCAPNVFRPNEWVARECLIRATNMGDEPLRDIVTSLTTYSGVPLEGYFILFAVDGSPLPIDPNPSTFAAGGELAPGVTAEVRLVTLVRMSEEGVNDDVWTTSVDGEAALTNPHHYEARDGAEAPPTGLSVEQVGYGQEDGAYFETTITNNSQSPVTQLSIMEHYGPQGVDFVTGADYEWIPQANLVKWDLASLGKNDLAPGETLSLYTVYDSQGNRYVQSGVLVEATVDGQQQLYGASAGNIYVGRNDQGAPSPVARVPQTGEGPSSRSLPVVALVALVATGVAFIGGGRLMRKGLRR